MNLLDINFFFIIMSRVAEIFSCSCNEVLIVCFLCRNALNFVTEEIKNPYKLVHCLHYASIILFCSSKILS